MINVVFGRPLELYLSGFKYIISFREIPQSDLQHFKIPTKEEKAKNTFEAFDTLQTQMQLCLEQLQNPMTTEASAEKLKILMDRCIYQCDVMFAIFSRNRILMTETRIEQTKVSGYSITGHSIGA